MLGLGLGVLAEGVEHRGMLGVHIRFGLGVPLGDGARHAEVAQALLAAPLSSPHHEEQLRRRTPHERPLIPLRGELERYGGDAGIDLCEEVFHADSDAVLSLLEPVVADETGSLRWRLTIKGLDALLTDVGFEIDRKLEILTESAALYLKEFGYPEKGDKSLHAKYRSVR